MSIKYNQRFIPPRNTFSIGLYVSNLPLQLLLGKREHGRSDDPGVSVIVLVWES